jgi:hypothetical protein
MRIDNMKKHRIEFRFDRKKNITNIYIWLGMQIVDIRNLNGQLTRQEENKISKEIKEEFNE